MATPAITQLIWKKDWQPSDSYDTGATGGELALVRLLANYDAIDEWLDDIGGFGGATLSDYLPVSSPTRNAIPFDEFLNRIERNLDALHVIETPIPWQPIKFWVATLKAPDFADVNRWETMGEALAAACGQIETAFRFCGMEYSGV